MKLDDVIGLFEGVARIGEDHAQARCPAHPDKSPSLSLRQSPDGKVLAFCHAGCSFEAISNAVGLRSRDWFEDTEIPVHRRPARGLAQLEREALGHMDQARRRALTGMGNELRRRDMERLKIIEKVDKKLITEWDAIDALAPLLTGYSELEWRFMELLRKT